MLKSIKILFPCRLIWARYQNVDKALEIDLLVTRNLTDDFITSCDSSSDYEKVTTDANGFVLGVDVFFHQTSPISVPSH